MGEGLHQANRNTPVVSLQERQWAVAQNLLGARGVLKHCRRAIVSEPPMPVLCAAVRHKRHDYKGRITKQNQVPNLACLQCYNEIYLNSDAVSSAAPANTARQGYTCVGVPRRVPRSRVGDYESLEIWSKIREH